MVYIAPSIRKCCYEVENDFYKKLKDKYENYFYKKEKKWYFSLQECAINKLDKNVKELIENHRCTNCDKDLFLYRKGDLKERILTIAWLED